MNELTRELMPLFCVTFFFLVAAHYIRWDEWMTLKWPHPARMLLNYVIGTVGWAGPFGWWLYLHGLFDVIWTMCGFIVVAGMAPGLSYANDTISRWRRDAQESKERERLMEKQRHAESDRI